MKKILGKSEYEYKLTDKEVSFFEQEQKRIDQIMLKEKIRFDNILLKYLKIPQKLKPKQTLKD